MATKEYKEKLRLENPEKFRQVYGTELKKRYLKRLKENDPEKYKLIYGGQQKRWRDNNPDKLKKKRRIYKLKKYGLCQDSFLKLLTEQDNKCKACGDVFTDSKFTHIDHCHESGKVRGILCINCNIALGYCKDNSNRLKSLIKYVESF